MAEDIELLSEHHPDLHGELQEVVCARTVTDDPIEAAIERVTDASRTYTALTAGGRCSERSTRGGVRTVGKAAM